MPILHSSADLPVHTLQDIIDFNEQHHAQEMPYFGQDSFHQGAGKRIARREGISGRARESKSLMGAQGIDAVMDQFKFDALDRSHRRARVADRSHRWRPRFGRQFHASGRGGYPHITVPMGFVSGLPVGISFFGRAWSEPTLIKFAFAFEQATQHRRRRGFLPRQM